MKNLHPLLDDRLRIPIEQGVSEYTGGRWTVKEFSDMHEFFSHPAATLSDGTDSVSVKFSEAANGLEQFDVEQAGLQLLSKLKA